MANDSSHPEVFIFIFTGSVDHMVSIPMNCWALWLIVSGKRNLIETELLTLNLLGTEILCSLFFFLSLLKISLISGLINFYRAVAVMERALFQCHICVDRYLAVVHPVAFIRYKKIRNRGACLAAVWLIVIWSGLCYVLIPRGATMFFVCSLALLVPALSIELFCSLSILRILKKPGPGNKEAQEKKEGNQQKKRAIRIICVVLVMLVFNVVPFILLPLFYEVTQIDMITIAFTLSTVGSSVQGFLFLSRSGKLPCK